MTEEQIIQRVNQKVQELEQAREVALKQLDALNSAASKIEEIEGVIEVEQDFGFSKYNLVTIYVTVEKVHTTSEVLRTVVSSGFKIFRAPSKAQIKRGDRLWAIFPRDQQLKKDLSGKKISPDYRISLYITGSKCEYRKTGTKEVDVFEVVCE